MNKADQDDVFAPLENAELSQKTTKTVTDDTLNIVIDAINSSINGLIVTDRKGVIRYVNTSFCRMFEYSLKAVIGKDAAEG